MSIDALDSNLIGKRFFGSGIITLRVSFPTKENPTSAIVTGKALRLVTSMHANPSRSISLLLDRKPPPLTDVSLGTTFNRTRRCHKPCTRFHTPSTAPTIAVTVVQLTFMEFSAVGRSLHARLGGCPQSKFYTGAVRRDFVVFISAKTGGHHHYDVSAESSFAAASAALRTHEERHGRVDDSTMLRIVVDRRNSMLWGYQEHNAAQPKFLHRAGKVR